eukprot:133295_1
MSDLISPLEDQLNKKRKRDNNPSTFASDTDDSLCMDKPRKRLKIYAQNGPNNIAEIDLCSSDSEDNTNNKKNKKKKKHPQNGNKINKCSICNKSFRDLSLMQQQLHMNACLDMNEKDYVCPVCHINLTIYDENTRKKHMNKCIINAKKNNDNIEFENNTQLDKLDEKIKKRKTRIQKYI